MLVCKRSVVTSLLLVALLVVEQGCGPAPQRASWLPSAEKMSARDRRAYIDSQVTEGERLREQGDVDLAFEKETRALQLARDEHYELGEAGARQVLALLFLEKRESAKAEAELLKVLRIREGVLGDEHRDTAIAHAMLGNLYRTQGDGKSALPHLVAAYETQEFWDSLSIRDRADFCRVIADLYARDQEFGNAVTLYEHAVLLYSQLPRNQRGEMAPIYSSLGAMTSRQSRFHDATKWYSKALESAEESFGPQHESTAAFLWALGDALVAENRAREALSPYGRALTIYRGADDAGLAVARTLDRIGRVYVRQGKYNNALEVFREGLELYQSHGVQVEQARSYKSIAETLGFLGRHEDAVDWHRKHVETQEKLHGLGDARSADAYAHFGASLATTRRFQEAVVALSRARDGFLTADGPGSARAARAVVVLAQCHENLGNKRDALALYQWAIPLLQNRSTVQDPAYSLAQIAVKRLEQELSTD